MFFFWSFSASDNFSCQVMLEAVRNSGSVLQWRCCTGDIFAWNRHVEMNGENYFAIIQGGNIPISYLVSSK